MNYWSGYMNWPLMEGWFCEVCNHRGLTWGFVHGICRCDNCHTEYHMRPDGTVINIPFCMLKDDYREAAKVGWEKFRSPITSWDDDKWDEVMGAAQVEDLIDANC